MNKELTHKKSIAEKVIMGIAIILLCTSVCVQGGFFPICIALIGLLECVVCLFIKTGINLKHLCIMVLFSLWYLFCTIKSEFILEYAINALLPLTIVLFFIIVTSMDSALRKKLLMLFIKISVAVAGISIICCVYSIILHKTMERILFPFQYSNACGIYFAMLIILSKDIGNKFIQKGKFAFYAALILTQSVGAILLTIIVELVYGRSCKKFVVIVTGIILFILCFHSRIYQSAGTFIERLLQIRDGISCIAKNPIFGIGMGRWSELRNIYQSGFYEATLIHSSIIQIGVDSGIVGIALFTVCIARVLNKGLFNSKKYCICLGMFLIHSLMDCSMSFLGLDLLAALILSQSSESMKCQRIIQKKFVAPVAASVLLIFTFAEYGLLNIRNINNLFNRQAYEMVIHKYENNKLMQTSVNAKSDYAKSLYNTEQYDKTISVIDSFKYKTTDMLILRTWSSDYDFLIDALQKEKYNQKIYDEIREGANEDIQRKATEIFNQAVDEMSPLGKTLYNRMEK